jgi:hypothetical protein
MFAMRLSHDLKKTAGRPVFLFNASEPSWAKAQTWPDEESKYRFPVYITDGPFVYRTKTGHLLILWSSYGDKGYTMGIARSESGHIGGPWLQDPEPLYDDDGGHGMIFRSFDDRLFVAFHSPNDTPNERPVFMNIEETEDSLRIKK